MNVFPNSRVKYSLLALMVLGLLIRLGAAYLQPNYIDEGYNFYICKKGWLSIYNHLKDDVHTPLVHLLNYPLTQCTSNIFWMRLLGVICGTLNIGVAFVLFRRFLQPNISLLLSAFLACDYVLWRSEALFRPYGLLTLALTSVSLGMIDILRTGQPFRSKQDASCPRWPWILFFLACLMCACSHMLGVLALVPCFIWAFTVTAPTRRRALTCITLGAIPSIVWFVVGPLTQHHTSNSASNVTGNTVWAPILDLPNQIFNIATLPAMYQGTNTNVIAIWRQVGSSIFPWINICLFAIFIWSVWFIWKRLPREGSFLSTLVLFPPLMIILAIAWDKMELFQFHYVTPFTAIILLIPAYALAERVLQSLLIALIGITVLITALFPGNRVIWVQDWQSAFDFIEARQKPGDHIVVNIAYAFYSFALAYDGTNLQTTYDNGSELFVHHPGPGKLPAIPLRIEECNANLLDYFGSGNLFLVLCESEAENDCVALWLGNHYDIVDGAGVPSVCYWGRLKLLQLRRRSSATPPPPKSLPAGKTK